MGTLGRVLQPRPARKSGTLVLLAVSLALQLWALYKPGSPGPEQLPFPHADKVVHFVLFLLPAVALARLRAPRWAPWLLVAHAPLSEAIQSLIPHRGVDPLDIVADVVGIAVGCWLGRWPGQPAD